MTEVSPYAADLSQSCPHTSELAEWLDQPSRRRYVERHLERCPMCQLAAATSTSSRSPASAGAGASAVVFPARYERLSLLGSGGFGSVFRCRDLEMGRDVAIKVIHRHSDAPRDEARALAQVKHPNVIEVFDVVVSDRSTVIVMEFVEGTTLDRWLAEGRGHREIIAAFVAAGRGLQAIHDRDLVHRDFKPSNTLVSLGGKIKVADLGACTGFVRAGQASGVGTLRYMAPEQLAGGTIDSRADQFAFCLSLYEALYGIRPFSSYGVPRRSWPWNRIRRALERGLDPDPHRRWPSLETLLGALERGSTPRRTYGWIVAAALPLVVSADWIAGADWVAAAPPASAPDDPRPPSIQHLALAELTTAQTLLEQGRFAQADALASEVAARSARSGHKIAEARAWLRVGIARWAYLSPDEAIAPLQRAGWGGLAAGDYNVAVEGLSGLMLLAAIDGDAAEAVRLSELVERLRREGTVGDRARAVADLAQAKRWLHESDFAAAQALSERAQRFARTAPDEPLVFEARRTLARAHMGQGQWDLADSILRPLLVRSNSKSSVHRTLGEMLVARGRYAEAREHLETALEGFEETGARVAGFATAGTLGVALMHAEDLDGASRTLAQAQRQAELVLPPHHPGWFPLLAAMAEVAVRRDDLSTARDHYSRSLLLAEQGYGQQSEHAAKLHSQLCWIDRQREDWDLAQRHCERAVEVASTYQDNYTLSYAHRGLGWIAVAEDDPAAARLQFTFALEAAKRSSRGREGQIEAARAGLAELASPQNAGP